MPDIYDQHAKAFARVEAYVICKDGERDAASGRVFSDSLRNGAQPGERLHYRCGFTANRAGRGMENLPALVHETHHGGNRYYWLVAMEGSRPVYQVTAGERPQGSAGYYDLAALLRLKGDSL